MAEVLTRALLIGAWVCPLICGQDRFAGLDEYVSAGMKTWRVPGLAIAVVKDGEVVLARGYGVRKLGGDDSVTAETVFPIASCTKTFTATCIAMLVDEGQLAWDDPVRKHMPEFRVADPYVSEHVTIRDLLCHRTGLILGDLIGMGGIFTHDQMLNQIQYLEQSVPFRSKVTYNNLMFAVLGEIVERKSGKRWNDFVNERILGPLELKSTTTDVESVSADRVATRHRLYEGELAPLRSRNSDIMFPAGSVYSTATDMAKWLNLQLTEGNLNGQQLIKRTSLREMFSQQQSIPVKWRRDFDVYDSPFIGTGLGWFVREYRGRKIVQHGGAWGAEMAFVPEENLGVVVLSNRDANGLVWMLIYDLIDAYLVGADQAWSKGKKWDRWLAIGGPDTNGRELRLQRAELAKSRKGGTTPSLPLSHFTGIYRSQRYGDIRLSLVDECLQVKFGNYTAKLEHWEDDRFYARTVIEPIFDWLVKFDVDRHSVRGLEIVHVGWKDPDEKFLFTRTSDAP